MQQPRLHDIGGLQRWNSFLGRSRRFARNLSGQSKYVSKHSSSPTVEKSERQWKYDRYRRRYQSTFAPPFVWVSSYHWPCSDPSCCPWPRGRNWERLGSRCCSFAGRRSFCILCNCSWNGNYHCYTPFLSISCYFGSLFDCLIDAKILHYFQFLKAESLFQI